MYRKIMSDLEAWKEDKNRKPLILYGPRHVGKTYTLLEFGRKHYENVVYLNFEICEEHLQVFEETIIPDELIPVLSRLTKQTILQNKTLIILDEIQRCPKALASLPSFYDEARVYHVVAAGTITEADLFGNETGIDLPVDELNSISADVDPDTDAAGNAADPDLTNNETNLADQSKRSALSSPVSKAEIKRMFPMDLEEFMLAMGEEDLVEQIKNSFLNNTPLPFVLHNHAMRLFRQYLVVGGMPKCVQHFAETKDYVLVRHTQDSILASYLDDINASHTSGEAKRIRQVYDNIPVQLSKENTRFQYKLLKRSGPASEYDPAIEWLCRSGLLTKTRQKQIHPIQNPTENRSKETFKLYFSDSGLLAAKRRINPDDILYMYGFRHEDLSRELSSFKNGMIENYVQSQLTVNGNTAYCWKSNRGAEVDFVIEREGNLIPIEVKFADNNRAKSLKVYMEAYKPEYAIKLSAKNFGFKDGKKIVPLYAAFCI